LQLKLLPNVPGEKKEEEKKEGKNIIHHPVRGVFPPRSQKKKGEGKGRGKKTSGPIPSKTHFPASLGGKM